MEDRRGRIKKTCLSTDERTEEEARERAEGRADADGHELMKLQLLPRRESEPAEGEIERRPHR